MTPVLRQLHWLPIEARAQFKVLIMTYKALNGLGPGYLNERLRPYMPDRPLRSTGESLLREPSMKEIRRNYLSLRLKKTDDDDNKCLFLLQLGSPLPTTRPNPINFHVGKSRGEKKKGALVKSPSCIFLAMSTEQESFLWSQGTTKTYHIPIEHLDYKFIETCTDVKYLEKILKILRSGEEGFYPDLVLFCEKRIETLAPNSRALRREKTTATVSDFTAEEWEKINNEVKSWVMEMKEDEYKMQYATTDVFKENVENLPPVRSSDSSYSTGQSKTPRNKHVKKKNVPRAYREWDNFDVEKECSKIDGNEENKPKTSCHTNTNLPKMEIDTTGKNCYKPPKELWLLGGINMKIIIIIINSNNNDGDKYFQGMTTKEKNFIANREREKGNEAFVTGDYKEAIAYYVRSISAFPTVASYNNKAQAEIRLQNWHAALQDCETVLNLDPGNIKALMRRATVYNNLQNFKAAAEDWKEVLRIEPDNARAKELEHIANIFVPRTLTGSLPLDPRDTHLNSTPKQLEMPGTTFLLRIVAQMQGTEQIVPHPHSTASHRRKGPSQMCAMHPGHQLRVPAAED
ncbi:Sperm-associated antigen 1 [Varanus komodoensis]|nr:Sperm-associated antigen 1 [Varanus komodoensis]